MRDYPTRRHRPLAGLLLAAALLLQACAETPVQERPDDLPEPPDSAAETSLPKEAAADRSLPDSVYAPAFARAEAQLARQDWMQAERSLVDITAPLNHNDEAYLRYLQARIAWQRGRPEQARARLQDYPAADTALALSDRIISFQRQLSAAAGNYLDSARMGSRLLSADPQQPGARSLKASIWRDLERVPAEQLAAASGQADSDWQAWLDLARLTANASSPSALESGLRQWRDEHSQHPAASPLPGGLGALLDKPLNTQTVALLLPLSGRLAPAARAVQDGYLAAYYRSAASGAPEHELLVLDTSAYPDAVSAYQDAVRQGATMVVGPLSKQAVSAVGQMPDRPVPVLALNRSDDPLPPGPTALVQLSLSPEDEVDTLATQAWNGGARRALIVRPAGEWGDKLNDTLQQHWQALGGDIVSAITYASAEAYSDTIKQALQLDASEARARQVRAMLATNIETSARRRQDIDAIFLLAGSPDEARAIKPLLAFHYAGDIPVYAPSAVYSGIPGRGDSDLNGIILAELPWLLGADPGLRVAIAAGDTGSDSYTRLNALGADAFLLQSRFAQLQAGADALLRGSTGLLSMDPQLRIRREPQAATFDGGRLKPR
ncbi:penicillin-binding protein activator [Parahaliea aestuarii]|uniref:Penicillin-binding protein activator n=1 Tax=Parahaliea aestuarii TaxID=1852021 RepID=A0A5C9A5A8_9GAMM|nr:penicillin-binding protein activator [Parahaliea aestuarii]TXS94920.1 penicillin-binding protein activator [Parahaliea aestuarii]